MIHTVIIDANAEVAEVKKQFRKKLMTGGAVIRLSENLSSAEHEDLLRRFKSSAVANSVEALVLRELAQKMTLTPQIINELIETGLTAVIRELYSRSDIAGFEKERLLEKLPSTPR